MSDLVEAVLAGSRRSLARLLTMVENEGEGAHSALAALFPHTGSAWIIGVTGAPGSGKSSLVNALAKAYRQQGKTVGIIAVDPTSPFSGGAILGDRIRMRDHSGDAGVFIRSMATRGSLGGLARATKDAVRVLDAAGFDIVLVETVGAGQSEVDIVRAAQTTLVVEAPGMGDDVQAIKAGILEIADVLVVNKADNPGAQNTVRGLRAMLELGHPASRSRISHHGHIVEVPAVSMNGDTPLWIPPVVQTVAPQETGITELVEAIEKHRRYLTENPAAQQLMEQQRVQLELYERLQALLMNQFLENVSSPEITGIMERILAREIDPQTAAQSLVSSCTNVGT